MWRTGEVPNRACVVFRSVASPHEVLRVRRLRQSENVTPQFRRLFPDRWLSEKRPTEADRFRHKVSDLIMVEWLHRLP